MNILLINDWIDVSATGSANSVMKTKKILEKEGHNVFLLSGEKNKPTIFSFFGAWFSARNYFRTKKIIRKNNIDIVHINNCARFISPSPILAAKKMSKKVVMTFHNTYYYCPKGWAVDKNYKECKKGCSAFCLFNDCPSQKESAISFFYHFIKWVKISFHRYFIKKYVDHFICPSKKLKRNIQRTFQFPENKVSYLANFIEVKNYYQIKFSKIQNNQFLFVGRISKEKGVDVAVKAIDLLIKKEGLKNIKLKIIGSGKEKNRIEKLVKKMDLKNNVKFLGRINNDKIDKYYQESIAVLVPSLWFEVFGLVNLEAMRNRTPIIASDIGGISEIVDHNKSGYLFEAGNYEKLSYYMKKLYRNIELSKNLGEEGFKKFEKEFSEKLYYQKLLNIYLNKEC